MYLITGISLYSVLFLLSKCKLHIDTVKVPADKELGHCGVNISWVFTVFYSLVGDDLLTRISLGNDRSTCKPWITQLVADNNMWNMLMGMLKHYWNWQELDLDLIKSKWMIPSNKKLKNWMFWQTDVRGDEVFPDVKSNYNLCIVSGITSHRLFYHLLLKFMVLHI